jgi:hypothetical protein
MRGEGVAKGAHRFGRISLALVGEPHGLPSLQERFQRQSVVGGLALGLPRHLFAIGSRVAALGYVSECSAYGLPRGRERNRRA